MEIHVSNSDELMCSSYCNLQLRQHILMSFYFHFCHSICIYFTAGTEHGGNKDKAPDQTRRCAGLQTEPR